MMAESACTPFCGPECRGVGFLHVGSDNATHGPNGATQRALAGARFYGTTGFGVRGHRRRGMRTLRSTPATLCTASPVGLGCPDRPRCPSGPTFDAAHGHTGPLTARHGAAASDLLSLAVHAALRAQIPRQRIRLRRLWGRTTAQAGRRARDNLSSLSHLKTLKF